MLEYEAVGELCNTGDPGGDVAEDVTFGHYVTRGSEFVEDVTFTGNFKNLVGGECRPLTVTVTMKTSAGL